jgi:hypothetical protein
MSSGPSVVPASAISCPCGFEFSPKFWAQLKCFGWVVCERCRRQFTSPGYPMGERAAL